MGAEIHGATVALDSETQIAGIPPTQAVPPEAIDYYGNFLLNEEVIGLDEISQGPTQPIAVTSPKPNDNRARDVLGGLVDSLEHANQPEDTAPNRTTQSRKPLIISPITSSLAVPAGAKRFSS